MEIKPIDNSANTQNKAKAKYPLSNLNITPDRIAIR